MTKYKMSKARRDHELPPVGKYDEYGRWFPSPFERCICCDRIKQPTKNRPLSILKHCRTANHVRRLVSKHQT